MFAKWMGLNQKTFDLAFNLGPITGVGNDLDLMGNKTTDNRQRVFRKIFSFVALKQRNCGNKNALTPPLDEIDEGAQGRRQKAAPGIIKKRPRKARPPVFQHRLQSPAVEKGPQPIFEQIDDACSAKSHIDRQIGRRPHMHDQRPAGLDHHGFARAFELPGKHRAARETSAQTGVRKKIARMRRPAAPLKIG